MKRMKNKKLLLMIVLSAFYIGFAFPSAFTYATIQEGVHETAPDEQSESEVTIEDEPVAEAKTFDQNKMIYTTQIAIITLGIIMAGAGTYVFVFKNNNKE